MAYELLSQSRKPNKWGGGGALITAGGGRKGGGAGKIFEKKARGRLIRDMRVIIRFYQSRFLALFRLNVQLHFQKQLPRGVL